MISDATTDQFYRNHHRQLFIIVIPFLYLRQMFFLFLRIIVCLLYRIEILFFPTYKLLSLLLFAGVNLLYDKLSVSSIAASIK